MVSEIEYGIFLSGFLRLHGCVGYFCIDGRCYLLTDLACTSNICWRLTLHLSMVNLKAPHHPVISYRPIQPSDLEVLENIHGELFPIRSDDLVKVIPALMQLEL